jgi:hypothetical protein
LKGPFWNSLSSLSLFQNPVGFETNSWKSGQMSAFPCKSKEAVPKTEVLKQPPLVKKVFYEKKND